MDSDVEQLFNKGYNCAQSVLGSLASELGVDHDLTLRIASGLGGGCGRQGEICGALTGAILAIGLKHGSSDLDPKAKARTYAAVGKLLDEFRTCHGAIRCRDLIGCDLSTPEEREDARAKGVLRDRCPCFVRDAAALAGRLIRE